MPLFTGIALVVGYAVVLSYCLGRRASEQITPSTFWALSIAVQCSPLFLLSTENGHIVSDFFSVSITPIAVMLLFGYYFAVFIYFFVVRRLVLQVPTSNAMSSVRRPLSLSVSIIIAGTISLLYLVATPRFEMFQDLIRGLKWGSSQDLNVMRRVEYAHGFFYTKVFTWIRYSISPAIALYLFSKFPQKRLWLWFGGLISYAIYFVMSASFHKATWIMGIVYIAGFALVRPRIRSFARSDYWKIAVLAFGGICLVFFLLTASYFLQYRANDRLTMEGHFWGSIARVTDAVPWGLAAFYDVFPRSVGFMGDEVLLAPFIPDARTPEALVAFAFGLETTIQPGVLANLYAGIGWASLPLYWVVTIIFAFVADWVARSIPDDNLRSIMTVILGVSLALNPQSPLYPSLFSSGLFLNCVVGMFIIWSYKPSQIRNRVRSVHRPRNKFE